MSSAPERFTPGRVIAEKYRIDRVLGIGGMGVVVLATHLQLLQPVALKFLLASKDDPKASERFLREARAAVRLTSQHVCRVLDVGTTDEGEPYMVMEYLQGCDLWALLKERAPSIDEAVGYVRQACDALSEAHALGIVHRDLKPSNLFLVQRAGGPPLLKVLDFGVSKINNPTISGDDAVVTQQGAMLGSPAYMAPEQVTATASVDARADIWSLGVVLYELVTRRLPFEAETLMQLGARVLHGDPPPPRLHRPDLPRTIEAIILRCLEKDPAKRFASANELAAALQQPSSRDAFMATIPSDASAPSGPPPHVRTNTTWGGPATTSKSGSLRRIAWGGALVVFAVAAGSAAYALATRGRSTATPVLSASAPPPAVDVPAPPTVDVPAPPAVDVPDAAPSASVERPPVTPKRTPKPTRPATSPPPPPRASASPTATALPDER
jgi:eukaryotic-like serine/threonine-protein kinase